MGFARSRRCKQRRNTKAKLAIKQNKKTPTDLENLSGLIICLVQSSFLSVGAFFERPQANTVRPYRVSGDFSAKNISLLGCFILARVDKKDAVHFLKI